MVSIAKCSFIFLFLFGASLSAEDEGNVKADHESDPPTNPNTTLVLVAMRHGERNPGHFLPGDPNEGKWGQEGVYMLTPLGKKQAYGLGQMLRRRYKDLISEQFVNDEIKRYSSSADRCQMTLQTCLAGLYPPKDETYSDWNDQVLWQPISYKIDDPLLRMYSVSKCKPQEEAWQPISDDNLEELQEMLKKDKPLIDYIAQQTGWNGSLSKMADVADNLIAINNAGLEFPEWITNATLEGYDNNLADKILEFRENHQIMCANYKPCRDLMGGVWLKNVIDILKSKRDGKSEKLKIVTYASHTEIVMSICKLLNMDINEVTYTAGFLIEYRDQPEPSVRIFFQEPTNEPYGRKIDTPTFSPPCPGEQDGWCPLDNFIKLVEKNAIDDWEAACAIPKCPN